MTDYTDLERNRQDRTVTVIPDRNNPYRLLTPESESDDESIDRQANRTNVSNTTAEAEEAYTPPVILYSSNS